MKMSITCVTGGSLEEKSEQNFNLCNLFSGSLFFFIFFHNFSIKTGIFLGFIKHEIILRAGFPKGQIVYTFPIKKIAFPEPLDWLLQGSQQNVVENMTKISRGCTSTFSHNLFG
jgi:hypothetical protein